MFQEFGRDDGAHGVAAEILRSGATAAIPVEAGDRIGAALFERPSQHVSVGHGPTSLTPGCTAPTGAVFSVPSLRSLTLPILLSVREKFRRTRNLAGGSQGAAGFCLVHPPPLPDSSSCA
ncbi:hypothetical protein GCM10027088_11410 [Nocardia goodfellowii]